MASYDLTCDDCGHAFEVFRQGFITDDDRICPACGSLSVRQKFSSFLRSVGTSTGGGCAAPGGSPFG